MQPGIEARVSAHRLLAVVEGGGGNKWSGRGVFNRVVLVVGERVIGGRGGKWGSDECRVQLRAAM